MLCVGLFESGTCCIKWLCRHSKLCNRWVGDFAMLSCHHSQKGWYLPHVLSQNWYHTDLIRRICMTLQVPFMAWPQGLSLQPFHSLETLAYAFSIFFLCNCAHVLGLPLNQVRKVALVTGFEEQILRSIPAEELWKCSLLSFRNFSIWFALAFPSCGSCGGLWELWELWGLNVEILSTKILEAFRETGAARGFRISPFLKVNIHNIYTICIFCMNCLNSLLLDF